MKIVLGIVGAVVALGLGAFAFVYFAGGSGEPTTDVTAPTIVAAEDTITTESTGATQPAAEESGLVDLVLTDATATFELEEVLRGEPKNVAGSTTEIAGRIQVDPADLSFTVVSDIIINARTFATDSGVRDRAIRGPVILDSASDEFELITFSPTSIDGLADSAEVGDELNFTIDGDLEIKGTTNPVTFEVTSTLTGPASIEGMATTTVNRTEWGIDIPSVASVADVTEAVVLTITFTAQPEA